MELLRLPRKLRSNLLNARAPRVLGPEGYLRYLACVLGSLPEIAAARDFRPVDRKMGRYARRFLVRGQEVFFDCRFCDERLRENSYGFGAVREIYVRDCYLGLLPDGVMNAVRSVIDLGANRGAFSALMASRGATVVCVEPQEIYNDVLHHNMTLNKPARYRVINALVGGAGVLVPAGGFEQTVDQILDKAGLPCVDLVKMDIEGSEFGLFEHPRWLNRVTAIVMEVHSKYGRPESIVHELRGGGFSVEMKDADLRLVTKESDACFIGAWKQGRDGR